MASSTRRTLARKVLTNSRRWNSSIQTTPGNRSLTKNREEPLRATGTYSSAFPSRRSYDCLGILGFSSGSAFSPLASRFDTSQSLLRFGFPRQEPAFDFPQGTAFEAPAL